MPSLFQKEVSIDRPFLVGEKVYLRPFDLDDLEGDYAQWINDGEIIKFLASNAFPKTKESLTDYVKAVLNDPNSVFFAIVDKQSNQHVGNAKLGPINWIDRRTHYGRILSKDTWGKGFGTDALRLLIFYSFEVLNLNRIVDFAVSENQASIKSNQKAGMDVEGEIKEWLFRDGRYQNVTILGLTKTSYLEKKKAGLI